jgi:hypothetical protein
MRQREFIVGLAAGVQQPTISGYWVSEHRKAPSV